MGAEATAAVRAAAGMVAETEVARVVARVVDSDSEPGLASHKIPAFAASCGLEPSEYVASAPRTDALFCSAAWLAVPNRARRYGTHV